jgi:CBS domain containing-hemolysin-like protein
MTALIIAILFFLILSAFFSGAEIAFISANKLGIEVEKNKGTRRGSILASLYKDPKDFLGTMLVGNNIALVAFTYLMTKLLSLMLVGFIGEGIGLALVNMLLITAVVLIFGEFLPKVLFRLYANETLYIIAYPLVIMRWILRVPAWIMIKTNNLLLKNIFRSSVDITEDAITRLDLQDFVEGSVAPQQDEMETDMFKNALHLKRIKVSECMVPRTEIEHIDVSEPIEALIEMFQKTRHSRIMITEGDLDNVLGYAHHQQLLDNPKTIKKIVIEIPFVPEVINAQELLLQFIRESAGIACVVDEFGGTAGIVTLEDLLEEIFGEIEDEYDIEEHIEEQIDENQYLLSGRLELDYLREKYPQLHFPEGEYHTLSGYIIMTSGTIPEEGEVLELEGLRFVFESVTEKKIETVRVFVVDSNPND